MLRAPYFILPAMGIIKGFQAVKEGITYGICQGHFVKEVEDWEQKDPIKLWEFLWFYWKLMKA